MVAFLVQWLLSMYINIKYQKLESAVCIWRWPVVFDHPARLCAYIMIKKSVWYMDVSENSGTPKSSILIGFSIINHPFWGTPIFGNTHILKVSQYQRFTCGRMHATQHSCRGFTCAKRQPMGWHYWGSVGDPKWKLGNMQRTGSEK